MERSNVMPDAPETDRLVARLLARLEHDDEASSSSPHPDEETLASFAMGELRGPERDELIRHLSECRACRQTASAVMSWPEIAGAISSDQAKPTTAWGFRRSMAWVGLAAVASVLLALGTLMGLDVRGRPGVATEADAFAQADDLLRRGRFDEARAAVAEAAHRGIKSDRLRSIEADAIRRIPGGLALAEVGRLTDFGFEIGGVTARSTVSGLSVGQAEDALKALGSSDPADDTTALNRGHALLSLQRPREALTEFQRVAGRTPGSAPARLGEGLAAFALADYPAAENAFRACLQLDPGQSAARINLAMTLAEEGKIDEALNTWAEVLEGPGILTDEERGSIRREVEELRATRQRTSSPSPDKEPR
jgi:tetratricopeptide (TPR) repeat protein